MRYPRTNVSHVPYHVFARRNNKQVLFYCDEDRRMYLNILEKAHKKFDFTLFTYALMDNHFHLLLQMLDGTLSALMHWVQLGYARYFNRRHAHLGHVFQTRYHAPLVEKESYFLTVDRYIHLNPVRAGMAQKPEDYLWSSYRSRLFGEGTITLDHETVLAYFGQDKNQSRKNYREFTESVISKPEEWSHDVLEKTITFGSPEFAERMRNLQ